MGLLMRYILVMNYKTEIDFCKEIAIEDNGQSFDFQFESLNVMRK